MVYIWSIKTKYSDEKVEKTFDEDDYLDAIMSTDGHNIIERLDNLRNYGAISVFERQVDEISQCDNQEFRSKVMEFKKGLNIQCLPDISNDIHFDKTGHAEIVMGVIDNNDTYTVVGLRVDVSKSGWILPREINVILGLFRFRFIKDGHESIKNC